MVLSCASGHIREKGLLNYESTFPLATRVLVKSEVCTFITVQITIKMPHRFTQNKIITRKINSTKDKSQHLVCTTVVNCGDNKAQRTRILGKTASQSIQRPEKSRVLQPPTSTPSQASRHQQLQCWSTTCYLHFRFLS